MDTKVQPKYRYRVELHMHTQMSAAPGAAGEVSLLDKALEHKFPAVAVTDYGAVHRFPDVQSYAAMNGIKVIYGMECFLDENRRFEDKRMRWEKPFHATLLVKNREGLRNLYKLITEGCLKSSGTTPLIKKKLLSRHRQGLLVGSACSEGELWQALIQEKSMDEVEAIARYYDFLEVQPMRKYAGKDNVDPEWEYEYCNRIRTIIELGRKLGKPVVATGDVQHPDELATTEDMMKEFSFLEPETVYQVVIKNTNEISHAIEEIRPLFGFQRMPRIDGADVILTELAVGKALEMYGEQMPDRVSERLEWELKSIYHCGVSSYYLLIRELVLAAREHMLLTGFYGSICGSFIAFLLGMTDVNPLPPHYICMQCRRVELVPQTVCEFGTDLEDRECPVCRVNMKKDGFHIPAEVFMGFDGDKLPGFILKTAQWYQPFMVQQIRREFGPDNVIQGGIPYLQADTKMFFILPETMDVFDFTPLQYAADHKTVVTHHDRSLLQYSLDKVEITECAGIELLYELFKETGVEPGTIEPGDKRVLQLFSSVEPLGIRGETVNTTGVCGIPTLEDGNVRQALYEMKPCSLEDISRILTLASGTNSWLKGVQALIVNEKVGLREIISTREDIYFYLQKKGVERKKAFTIMQRVSTGKGIAPDHESLLTNSGIPPWYVKFIKAIKQVCSRAHILTDLLNAYRLAWYKLYHPKAFYRVVLNRLFQRQPEVDLVVYCPGDVKMRFDVLTAKEQRTAKEECELNILMLVDELFERGFTLVPEDDSPSGVEKAVFVPDSGV